MEAVATGIGEVKNPNALCQEGSWRHPFFHQLAVPSASAHGIGTHAIAAPGFRHHIGFVLDLFDLACPHSADRRALQPHHSIGRGGPGGA